uniref:Uncharacterized protein n=1 Tax=Oryza glumipatula TaxID=40148 RepID=A0A0D9YFS0_9ORYZ
MAPLPFSLPYRRRCSISPSPSRIAGTAPCRRVLDGGTAATTTVLSSPLPVDLDGGATVRAILLSFSPLPPSRRRAPEDRALG